MIKSWSATAVKINYELSYDELVRLVCDLPKDEQADVVIEMLANFDIRQLEQVKEWINQD